jgi:hypothetical protein
MSTAPLIWPHPSGKLSENQSQVWIEEKKMMCRVRARSLARESFIYFSLRASERASASVTDLSATLPTGKRPLRKVQEFALAHSRNPTTNYLLKNSRRNKKFHPLSVSSQIGERLMRREVVS